MSFPKTQFQNVRQLDDIGFQLEDITVVPSRFIRQVVVTEQQTAAPASGQASATESNGRGDGRPGYRREEAHTGKTKREQRAEGKAARPTAKEWRLRDAVVELMRKAGIEMVTDEREGQRVRARVRRPMAGVRM